MLIPLSPVKTICSLILPGKTLATRILIQAKLIMEEFKLIYGINIPAITIKTSASFDIRRSSELDKRDQIQLGVK